MNKQKYSLQDFKNKTIKSNNLFNYFIYSLILSLLLLLYSIASTMEYKTLTQANRTMETNINALYEQDMRGEIELSQEDIKILQVIDNNQ